MVRAFALAAVFIATASLATATPWDFLAVNVTHPQHEPSRRLALTCALQSNIDFIGNDISNTAGATPSDCCSKCAANTRCNAFSWASGVCYLKTGKGATKVATGVVSAEVGGTCSVENNIDYIGNDVGSVVAPAGKCCALCNSLSTCGAYTWSNFNGGTCWLKSSKGATKTTAGVISGVVSATPATCSAEKDIDYEGNDISNVAGVAADSCCSSCANVAGCKAFTWSNNNGGTCYLKSGKGATKAGTGLVSGVIGASPPPITTAPPTPPPTTTAPPTPPPTTTAPPTPPPTTTAPPTPPPSTTAPPTLPPNQQCTVEVGVDYVANDLSNVPGTVDTCCAACYKVTGCKAYTWSSGTCYLKSGKGATKAAAGLVSGVVGSTPPPSQCTVEVGVDYIANDLSNARGLVDSCCAACSKVTGCKAYTWSSYDGGTCYFKSGKGATKATAGLVSGVVGSTPTTAPPPTPPPTTTTPRPITTAPPPTTTAPPPTTTAPPPTTTAPPPTVTPAPGQQCTIEKGLDYVGNDLLNVPGVDATACCAKCLEVGGCNAFAFAGGVCYLKSAKGTTTANANVDSGTVSRPPPTNSCTLEENTNFVGLDIANFPRDSAQQCCTVCASYSGCGAFTWTNFNGGTCWLKSDKGRTTVAAGSWSARVTVANPPKTHIQYALRSRAVRTRSVNLGNWLMSEYWMWYDSPAYKDVWSIGNQGEYIVMQARTALPTGRAAADAGFEAHRKEWITETDIAAIAAAGLNSVRVPVGFWIVGDDASITKNSDMSVFAPGALKYLDKLINEWAVTHNVAVMLSLHAHMRGQSKFDHSAPPVWGVAGWGWGEPYANSVQFATFLAARYKRSPAFLGMNMMNEPVLERNVMDAVYSYYREVYNIVRADGNDCILVTSPHLDDQGSYANGNLMTTGYYNVWHEFHIYYKWGLNEGRSADEVLNVARNYGYNNLRNWNGNPIYIGEWTLATSTRNGPITDVGRLRELANIQMTQFQGAAAGWAFWSWKHGDEDSTDPRRASDAFGWSFRRMRKIGALPDNLF